VKQIDLEDIDERNNAAMATWTIPQPTQLITESKFINTIEFASCADFLNNRRIGYTCG